MITNRTVPITTTPRKDLRATLLLELNGSDTTTCVWRIEWTHSIFKTREREIFTVWSNADAEDWVIYSDGTYRQLDQMPELEHIITQATAVVA